MVPCGLPCAQGSAPGSLVASLWYAGACGPRWAEVRVRGRCECRVSRRTRCTRRVPERSELAWSM
eukprot:14770772-Heterocapsa_arctica.AAC.1